MSIYSNVTEQDLVNLHKLAEQQKHQRAEKIKNRILKQTHDNKLAESLSPITKKSDIIKETTKQLGEIVKKPTVEDGNIQTPAIENTNISRSIIDTLAFMKTIKNFFKLIEDGAKVYWNDILIKPLGDNGIRIKNREYDITPDIQAYLTNTKFTTKFLDDVEEEIEFDMLQNVGFYDNIPKEGFNSARMKNGL